MENQEKVLGKRKLKSQFQYCDKTDTLEDHFCSYQECFTKRKLFCAACLIESH